MASKILSITISDEWIKIAEVAKSAKSGVQIFNAITLKTPENSVNDGNFTDIAILADAIAPELKKNQMGSKIVNFSLQSSRIVNKEVVIPFMKDAKIPQYLNTNIKEYIPVNDEEYILDYKKLGEFVNEENKKSLRITLSGAPAKMVRAHYALSKALGLTVQAIDHAANSNLQATKLQIEDGVATVIQVGEESTSVSIFFNKELKLMRTVPYGKSTVAQALIEKRDDENLTLDEAYRVLAEYNVIHSNFSDNEYVTDSLRYMVNNISRVLDYFVSKNQGDEYAIKKAFLITEGSKINELDRLLRNELAIDVVELEQLVNVDTSATNLPLPSISLYFTNIGAIIEPTNFIPAEAAAEKQKVNSGKYTRLFLYVAIIVAILLIGFPLLQSLEKKSKKADLQSSINSLQYVKAIVADYYVAKDANTDLESFKTLSSNYDDELLDFVEFLENDMPSDISISNMSISNGSVSMSISGSSKETMAAFLVKLKSNPSILMPSIPALSESVDSEGMATVSCSMTCQFIGSDVALEDESGMDVDDEEASNEAGADDLLADYNE